MSRLSANQMRELAHSLKKISKDLDSYVWENRNNIPQEMENIIASRQFSILRTAHDLLTNSIIVSIEEAESTLNQIVIVTERIEKVLETIDKIGKVINIATSVAALAISISTGNVGGITTSVSDIVEILDSNID